MQSHHRKRINILVNHSYVPLIKWALWESIDFKVNCLSGTLSTFSTYFNQSVQMSCSVLYKFVFLNSRRQHLCQQLLCFLLLDLQLLRPLPDQLLQVRGVLLQHPQHWVYDVRLLPLVDVLKLSRYGRIQMPMYRNNIDLTKAKQTFLTKNLQFIHFF